MGAGSLDARIRVAIVDDHPVVIQGIESWLATEPRIDVVHVGDDAAVFTAESTLNPDVIVLDLSLHGRIDLDTVARLTATGQRVVVYTQFTGHNVVMRAIDSGAHEVVAKHEGRDHLVAAVVAAAKDEAHVSPTMAGALINNDNCNGPRLSDRERTALLLWFQSSSKGSVARRMQVSPHTVDMYIRRARLKYAKLGRPAFTKTELLARAIEDNLVRPQELGRDDQM